MSEIKLLPCPFCGGEAEIISSCFFGWDKQIICTKCGASTRELCGVTPSKATKNAVKKWNTRKPMERIVERVEEQIKEYDEEWERTQSVLCLGGRYGVVISMQIVKEEGGIE